MKTTKNTPTIKRFDRISSLNRDGVTVETLVVERVLDNGQRYQVTTTDGEDRPDILAHNTWLAIVGGSPTWKTDQLDGFNAKYA